MLSLVQALRVYGEATALEQKYLIKYLQTFDPESQHAAIDSGVQSLACTAISACVVRSGGIHLFSTLLSPWDTDD